MSGTTPGPDGRRDWPFGPVDGAGAPAGPPPQDRPTAQGDGGRRRRPPVWLLVVAALVVVGLVVAAVLVLGNREAPEPPPVAEPDVVTLAPPSPTVEPAPRDPGTAFSDSLPSTVLALALTEIAPDEAMIAAGALEAYRVVYDDGSGDVVTVTAGQWRDAAGAEAALVAELAAAGVDPTTFGPADDTADAADADADDTAADDAAPETPAPASPEAGPVLVDGAEVGRYVFTPHEDGTGTLWWTNGTVLLRAEGAADALLDVFAAFPL